MSRRIAKAKKENRSGRNGTSNGRLARTIVVSLSSKRGFFYMAGAVLLLNLAACLLGALSGQNFTLKDADTVIQFLQVLWQVQAGILGITFVVVVFLMQSIVVPQYREGGLFRFFVTESWILPVAYLGLLTIASIMATLALELDGVLLDLQLSYLAALNVCLFSTTLLLTAVLYQRSLGFLSPSFIQRAITATVRERVGASIEDEIDRNIGRAVMTQVAGELGIEVREEWRQSRPDWTPIRLADEDDTQISDINFDTLKECVREIKRPTPANAQLHTVLLLTKTYGSIVSAESRTVAYTPTRLTSPEVERRILAALKTRPRPEEDLLRESFDYLMAETTRAVQARQPIELERLLRVYVEALSEFLSALSSFGIVYTDRMANQALGFEWRAAARIRHDLYRIVENTMRTQDRDLIAQVVFFPVQMMRLAVRYNDHLLFQDYSRFYPDFYALSHHLLSDKLARDYVLDRSWRHFDEFCAIDLKRYLDVSGNDVDASVKAASYLKSVIVAFNSLLKRAVDIGDHEGFRVFGEALDNLAGGEFQSEDYYREKIQLEHRLSHFQGPDDERREVGSRFEKVALAVSELDDVTHLKALVWFGIGGWLVNLYAKGRMEAPAFERFYAVVSSHFSGIEGLVRAFVDARQEKFGSDRLPWSWWDMESRADGIGSLGNVRASFIDTDSWLTLFYVVRGIALTPRQTDGTPPIPPTEGLESALGGIRQICQQVLDERLKWQAVVLPDGIEERTRKFLVVNEQAVAQQQRVEEDLLISKDLNPERIAEFRSAFTDSWLESTSVRRLLERAGKVINRTTEPPPSGLAMYGFSTLVHKDTFLTESSFADDLGRQAGSAFATEDDRFIANGIKEGLANCVEVSEDEDLSSKLDEAVSVLRARGYSPSIVLSSSSLLAHRLSSTPKMVYSWEDESTQPKVAGYRGNYDGIPVITVNIDRTVCLVLDLERLGELTQYALGDQTDSILQVLVEKIDEDVARELLRVNPRLGRNQETNEEPTEEEAMRQLRKLVRLQVRERPHFRVADGMAGVYLQIVRPTDPQTDMPSTSQKGLSPESRAPSAETGEANGETRNNGDEEGHPKA